MIPADDIIVLPVEDEWPHPPEADAHWQESVVLCFQDIEQGLGGFIRIGHHPNLRTGNCTFGVVAPGLGYNRSRLDVPMREGDRFANGFAIDGFLTATFDSASNRWVAEDDDCSLDLHVENLHPHYDAWALSGLTGGFREKFASMHTEVAGRVRGTMRIGERSWAVDGFGHRDHSWGVRKHDDPEAALATFFWLVGSFGPELIFSMSESITFAGKRNRTGFVIQGGELARPLTQDARFGVTLDGMTMRDARVTFDAGALGTHSVELEGLGNVLLGMGGRYLEVGMPARGHWNGRTGGVHLSTMFNARGGTGAPPMLFGTAPTNGLHRTQAFQEVRKA